VFVLSRGVVRAWPLRVLLALVPAIIPLAPVEIAGTAANLHWYLLFLAPWVFAWRPRAWWAAGALAVVAGSVTASEIQAAVFLPLLLGRRSRRVVPVAVVALLGVAAQVAAALAHPRSSSHQSGITSFQDMTAGWFAQAVAGSWDADVRAVGATVSAHGWWVVVVPGVLVLGCIVLAAVRAAWPARWMLVAAVVGAVVVWYAALTVNRTPGTDWSSFTPAAWAGTAPLRYAAASSMFLTAAVVIAGDVLTSRVPGARRTVVARASRGLGVVLVAATVAVAVLGAGAVPLRAAGPVWSAEVQRRAATCAADPADHVRIGAMPRLAGWDAVVPCAMVDEALGGRQGVRRGSAVPSSGATSVASRAWVSTSNRSEPYRSFSRSTPSAANPARTATAQDPGLFVRCPSSSRCTPRANASSAAETSARVASPRPRAPGSSQ
jgi:hypothetical protein